MSGIVGADVFHSLYPLVAGCHLPLMIQKMTHHEVKTAPKGVEGSAQLLMIRTNDTHTVHTTKPLLLKALSWNPFPLKEQKEKRNRNPGH